LLCPVGWKEFPMKQAFLSLAMASLLVVPVALAAQAPQTRQRTPSPTAQTSQSRRGGQGRRTAAQTHVVNAEFVSYDANTKVITIKDDKGQTSTAPLQGRALREMSQMHLKAGDHLMVTCRDNAKGEHQAVTDIKLAKPAA
jgi:hypothetical protein